MNLPNHKQPVDWANKSLLCIDKDRLNSFLIKEFLCSTGISISYCSGSCQDCENFLQPNNYDIILLNLQNRFEHKSIICQRVESFPIIPPIIACTSVPKKLLRMNDSLFDFIDDFLLLPLSEHNLKEVLKKHIS